jgi:nuclear GTP-binding protein
LFILLKGGESNISSSAKMVLNDFQRGKLPYYMKPPGCDENEDKVKKSKKLKTSKDETVEGGEEEVEEKEKDEVVEEKDENK